MWCINLSNLVIGVLWFLSVASFVGVIYLLIVANSVTLDVSTLFTRLQNAENNIEFLSKSDKSKKEVRQMEWYWFVGILALLAIIVWRLKRK